MDLANQVIATITNVNAETTTDLRDVARRARDSAPGGAYKHELAQAVGHALRDHIGDINAYRPDGLRRSLWATFMGAVDWVDVGRYYLDAGLED
jgi:hypothetical protein